MYVVEEWDGWMDGWMEEAGRSIHTLTIHTRSPSVPLTLPYIHMNTHIHTADLDGALQVVDTADDIQQAGVGERVGVGDEGRVGLLHGDGALLCVVLVVVSLDWTTGDGAD